MKIHFCDLCNESVPQSDLDAGRAHLVKGRVVCATCESTMSLASPHEPAAPPPELIPAPAPSAAGGSSLAVWMAAAGLVLTAIVIYAFEQRVERLQAAELGLARQIENGNEDLRALDRELARVPEQTAELEARLSLKLAEALATNEKLRGELSTAARQNEHTIAELQRSLAGLRKEIENAALDRERRLEELAHKLAQGDDAQRDLASRLEEFRKSTESARLASEAAARALPDKPPAVPALPAWHALLPNLADANPSTRWEAVDELGRAKDPAVIQHVLPLLRDSDLFVRMCAARVLADLGTLQGVPALLDALEDSEPTVRESAWNALRTLTGKDFKFDPQGNEADRAKKVKAWREWWKKEGEGLSNPGTPAEPKQPAAAK